MKTLITLLIAILFATIAYPYGATTVTYRAIGLNFATAIAGNFGLENGTFATWADVSDHDPPDAESGAFGNELIFSISHDTGPYSAPGYAYAHVNGHDAEGNLQQDNDVDSN